MNSSDLKVAGVRRVEFRIWSMNNVYKIFPIDFVVCSVSKPLVSLEAFRNNDACIKLSAGECRSSFLYQGEKFEICRDSKCPAFYAEDCQSGQSNDESLQIAGATSSSSSTPIVWSSAGTSSSSKKNKTDYWVQSESKWTRVHLDPRKKFFNPSKTTASNGPQWENLEDYRMSSMTFKIKSYPRQLEV